MIRRTLATLKSAYAERQLPPAAREEARQDRAGLSDFDPGIEFSVSAAVRWLLLAQEKSKSADGGVARHYGFLDGWATSYPETTGYILPTLVDWSERRNDARAARAARRMADWLVSIQFPEGGFQGGKIDAARLVPVTFNTGQILLGLARAALKWGEPYRESMNRAARWLVETQDPDGCWRKFPTPFAMAGEKAYETHVAWGLFEAARVEPAEKYEKAALANVRWALTQQRRNGWVANCCLDRPDTPLTHTLGYFLRGVLEAHRFEPDRSLLAAALETGRGLQRACGPDGRLPGRLDAEWREAADWVCLTGSVQVAHCFLTLYRETAEPEWRDAAFALNRFVRRTMKTEGPEGLAGGVKGAFPVWGDYGRYQYLNWAAKFFIDSNLREAEVRANE
jgi:hypothetical protein